MPSWVTLVLLVVGLVVYGVFKYCAALTEENPETGQLAKPLTLLLLTTLTLATICVIVFMVSIVTMYGYYLSTKNTYIIYTTVLYLNDCLFAYHNGGCKCFPSLCVDHKISNQNPR